MSVIEIKVPDIGDFDEVAVIELLVKPGDSVAAEQSLITVESDKASMEIPSSAAGTVKELKVKLGDKVKEGSVVLLLEAADVTATPAAAPAVESKPAATTTPSAQVAAKVEASRVAASDALVEVRVPDIGDFKDVAVIEVMVKAGDTVKMEQSLITVESDKASMEIPSSAAGVIKDLKVKLGDKLNIGDLLAVVQGAGVAAPVAAPAVPVSAPASTAASPVSQAEAPGTVVTAPAVMPAHDPTAPQGHLPHASPSVRKFARELGVPLAEVKGSGPKGRITQDDVQGFTRSVMAGAMQTQAQAARAPAGGGSDGAALGLIPWPKVDFTKFGTVERKDLSRIKKLSGANLHRNWVMIPHVTNNDEADITELEAFRVATNKENEKSGVKVTMLAFVIKAVVGALKKFPDFNASLDGDALVYKQYFNIGFAADTPNGLVVPV
ncbi:MAG: biotin/lipoyl-containing protein, partial [Rhodoferax sp.]